MGKGGYDNSQFSALGNFVLRTVTTQLKLGFLLGKVFVDMAAAKAL